MDTDLESGSTKKESFFFLVLLFKKAVCFSSSEIDDKNSFWMPFVEYGRVLIPAVINHNFRKADKNLATSQRLRRHWRQISDPRLLLRVN